MKRATNILFSSIMLILMLLGASRVSVEKCSCTGRVSLTLAASSDCCPDEGGCMTIKSLQLSEYEPVTVASIHAPTLPVFFIIDCYSPIHIMPATERQQWILCADVPPRGLATTVTVLRV